MGFTTAHSWKDFSLIPVHSHEFIELDIIILSYNVTVFQKFYILISRAEEQAGCWIQCACVIHWDLQGGAEGPHRQHHDCQGDPHQGGRRGTHRYVGKLETRLSYFPILSLLCVTMTMSTNGKALGLDCTVNFNLHLLVNPFINHWWCDDVYMHHLTSATCHQLILSVLRMRFALTKKWDRARWVRHSHNRPCTWQLPWLAVEWP